MAGFSYLVWRDERVDDRVRCMSVASGGVLGTPLIGCTYASLTADLLARASDRHPFAVDFTNTHIVTLRRADPGVPDDHFPRRLVHS